jgi:hypothetical protein
VRVVFPGKTKFIEGFLAFIQRFFRFSQGYITFSKRYFAFSKGYLAFSKGYFGFIEGYFGFIEWKNGFPGPKNAFFYEFCLPEGFGPRVRAAGWSLPPWDSCGEPDQSGLIPIRSAEQAVIVRIQHQV